jgi:hypothetical protein
MCRFFGPHAQAIGTASGAQWGVARSIAAKLRHRPARLVGNLPRRNGRTLRRMDEGERIVADASAFRLTYTPDYTAAFAVRRRAHRYFFTVTQQIVGALLSSVMIWSGFFVGMAVSAMNVSGSRAAGFVSLLVVGYFVSWLLVGGWVLPVLQARWLAQRKALVPLTFEASADGMHWQSQDDGLWLKWEAIERLFVTRTAVCFLLGGATPFIPRSAFADAAALKDFVELALSRLSEPARRASLSDRSVAAIRAAPHGR